MKSRWRWCLAVGFILTGEFKGVSQNATVGMAQTRFTITIHVHNQANVDHMTLMDAERVATEIFRKAGVESRWVDPALNSEKDRENSAPQGSHNLSHIQLDILPPLMAERLGLPSNAMGLAPGPEPDRQLIYVLYNRIETLGRRQPGARIGGGICASASTAQILGHAIAHEVGHLLLNLKSHSGTGIMRGDWGLKDLQDACYGYLLFTPRQAEIIQAEIGRRVGQQHAVMEAPPEASQKANRSAVTPKQEASSRPRFESYIQDSSP
jgi:hypothetical protein